VKTTISNGIANIELKKKGGNFILIKDALKDKAKEEDMKRRMRFVKAYRIYIYIYFFFVIYILIKLICMTKISIKIIRL